MSGPDRSSMPTRSLAKAELRSYVTGFAISALLSVAAFAAIGSDLAPGWKVAVVCIAALLQMAAHLRHFLHLSLSRGQSLEDLLLVLFSLLLLAIMAGGTIWILRDLHARMHGAPHEMTASSSH